MSVSYTVTPNGSIPNVNQTGGTVIGTNPGWTFPPNYGNPNTPQPPSPKQPQPQPPSVTFTISNLSDGLSVQCALSGQTPNSVSWAFNDSSNSSASGISIVHKFPRAGTYQISMEANYGGHLSFATKSVTVSGAPIIPVASFTSVVDGLAVLFTNSSNYAAGSVAWDFGDGSVFSGQAVIHVYDEPGTYTVTMTADFLIATNTVVPVFLTGFGAVFWTELTHANGTLSEFGVTNNLVGNTTGVNNCSAKSSQSIPSGAVGSGVIAYMSGGEVSGAYGNHTPYFGLLSIDTLPLPSSLMYAINFYTNVDTATIDALIVESGVVVQGLSTAIISAIGAGNIYFSITINAAGQIEYRYGTINWNAGNFVSWGPSTLWYTSTVAPVFPLYAGASLSYESHPV
jgi:PKD repeat protein